MRKLLLCLPLLTAFCTYAQKGTWNFSVGGGFGWGGPKTTFKKAMIKTHFNQKQSGWLGSSYKHPRVYPAFNVFAKGGKQVKEQFLFFVSGGVTAGSVDGYNQQDYGGSGWLYSNGARVSVNYTVIQLSAGLEHVLPHSNITIGYGPALSVLSYTNATHSAENYQSLAPGFNLSGALPLFKKRNNWGVALVTGISLALPARLKPLHHYYTKNGADEKVAFVPEMKATMTQGMIGLALTFRS